MDPQLFLVVMIAVEDTKSISFLTVEPFFLTGLTTVFLLFDHTPPSYFLFLSSNGEHKCWLLTFSSHCSCSSTSHLFTSRLRLVDWSTLKIVNNLPIFASYYAFVIVSLTWLSYFLSRDYLAYINSPGFLFIFCFSLTKGLRSKR